MLAGDRRAKYLNDYLPMVTAAHRDVLIVLETKGWVDRDELTGIDLSLVTTFPRPGGISVIQLYEISG